MSDWLTIHRLRLWAHVGVPEEERARPQMLEATLRFKMAEVTAAAETDDLERTVDYDAVAQRAKAIAAERPRRLIETLAEDLAVGLMEAFGLPRIEVGLRKFILPDTECVELVIERKRKKAKVRKLRVLPAPGVPETPTEPAPAPVP